MVCVSKPLWVTAFFRPPTSAICHLPLTARPVLRSLGVGGGPVILVVLWSGRPVVPSSRRLWSVVGRLWSRGPSRPCARFLCVSVLQYPSIAHLDEDFLCVCKSRLLPSSTFHPPSSLVAASAALCLCGSKSPFSFFHWCRSSASRSKIRPNSFQFVRFVSALALRILEARIERIGPPNAQSKGNNEINQCNRPIA